MISLNFAFSLNMGRIIMEDSHSIVLEKGMVSHLGEKSI